MYGIDYYALNNMLSLAIRAGSVDKKVVFEVFCRKIPYKYGVLAGIDSAIERITNLKFNRKDIELLISNGVKMDEKATKWLLNFKFSGNIFAMSEGECFLENEPVAIVYASYGECVIIENILLSSLSYTSSVASKASEISLLSSEKLIEMAARRYLPEQAITTAYASYIAGFDGTSNVDANIRYSIPLYGTVSHSYIQLHASERTAFINQQRHFQGSMNVFLVDTYDIEAAIEQLIELFDQRELNSSAIRIDSGCNQIIYRAKEKLIRAGLDKTKIILTGDVDLNRIQSIKKGVVDIYGIGSYLACEGNTVVLPFVYKMVAIQENGIYISKTKQSANKKYIGGIKRLGRRYGGSTLVKHYIYNKKVTASKELEGNPFPMVIAQAEYNPMRYAVCNGRINYTRKTAVDIRDDHRKHLEAIWGNSNVDYTTYMISTFEVENIISD